MSPSFITSRTVNREDPSTSTTPSPLHLSPRSSSSSPPPHSALALLHLSPPPLPHSPLGRFAAWCTALRNDALAADIGIATIDAALDRITIPTHARVVLDDEVHVVLDSIPTSSHSPTAFPPPLDHEANHQPELILSTRDYIEQLVPQRIWPGVDFYQEHFNLLRALEKQYGVPAEILVALWGIESWFGENQGEHHVLDALAHIAYGDNNNDEARRSEFRSELLHAMRILDQGHIRLDDMVGSWAGAMGQPQFLPSSFLSYAVDQDGDGRVDIWHSVEDALGSMANFLHCHDWKRGREVGMPVRIKMKDKEKEKDKSSSSSLSLAEGDVLTTRSKHPPSATAMDKKLEMMEYASVHDNAHLYFALDVPRRFKRMTWIQPDETFAFLGHLHNVKVLTRYNPSMNFALAVATLASEIKMRVGVV